MSQIAVSIDETGVNQIFRAIYNRLPATSAGKSASLGAAGGQFSLNATVRAEPVDYAPTAQPVNLLGTSLNPQIRIQPLGLRLVTDVSVRFQLGGWSRTATAQVTVDVTGTAHARVSASLQGGQWRTVLTVAAADVSVSLAPNRQPLVDAVKQALGHIDINPGPGTTHVPDAVVTQLVNLAFNQLVPPLEDALGTALRSQLGALRADLVARLPQTWPLQVPGSRDTLVLTITQLDPQITANGVRVVASFSIT